MTANLRTLAKEKRELPMTDTCVAAGNSAHLPVRTKAFGVMPSQIVWGILACCFIFLSGQLSYATCNTVTGDSGVGATDNITVLMLASTLTDDTGNPGGDLCTSLEAVQAQASPLNLNVEIDDPAAWGAKSTAQFATYRAMVLGDPDCPDAPGTGPVTEAENTTGTWGPAITGPVAIVGTDPEFHFLNGSGLQAAALTQNAIAFATSTSGQPGAYISLSCYYFTSAANTPVPVLAPFGSFEVQGQGSQITDNSTILDLTNPLATTPNVLTDGGLSQWQRSTHEAFNRFPSTFTAVVQSVDLGLPYILATNTQTQTQTVSPGETTTFDFQGGFAGGGYDYTVLLSNSGSPTRVQVTPILKSQADCDALVQKSFLGTHCLVYHNADGANGDFAVMFELICPDSADQCGTPTSATFDAELGTDYHFDKIANPGFKQNPDQNPFPGWLKGHNALDTAHPCTPNSNPNIPLFQSNQIESFTVIGDPTGTTKGKSGGTGSCWVATYNTPNEAPSVNIITPANGANYPQGAIINADFSCSAVNAAVANNDPNFPTGPYLTVPTVPTPGCTGTVPSGSPIDTTPGAHTFTATVLDSGSDTASKTVTYNVVGPADVAILKVASFTTPINSKLTYTIGVGDLGPQPAVDVNVTDVLPANTTFVSVSANKVSCSFVNRRLTCSTTTIPCTTGSTVSCNVGTLMPLSLSSLNGATIKLTVQLGSALTVGKTVKNTATVSGTNSDPHTGNNSSTASTLVTAPPKH